MTIDEKVLWTIRGLFWYCNVDDEKKTMDVTKKDIFCECAIIISSLELDIIEEALRVLNSHLPEYLKKKGLVQWIPTRCICYDVEENKKVFEICYYHHNILHDDIYIDDSKIDLSSDEIDCRNQFYHSYKLNWLSAEIYATNL